MLDVSVAAPQAARQSRSTRPSWTSSARSFASGTITRPTSATPPPRLWLDAIIEPARTREILIQAFDVATRVAAIRSRSRRGCFRFERGALIQD